MPTSPESELILDILDELPDYMLPTSKSSITAGMDLLDFRRILLDYEKGLRWNGPWNARRQDNHTSARPSNSFSNDRSRTNTTPAPRNRDSNTKDAAKPPGPCTCGGMHWFRDCPKKTTRSNNVSSFRSNPNRIPISKSKWPHKLEGHGKTDQSVKKLEARMNLVTIEEEDERIIEISLPGQDNDGFGELNESVGISKDYDYAVCNNAISVESSLQHRHTDKVPTFAMAKLGSKEGAAHEVSIDTGSAISLIDSTYLRKNFAGINVNPSSTIMLKGVRNNQTHGWVDADIHFVDKDKSHTSIICAFHVVTSLATNIGNDILAEEGD
jgi:hypothetical protein